MTFVHGLIIGAVGAYGSLLVLAGVLWIFRDRVVSWFLQRKMRNMMDQRAAPSEGPEFTGLFPYLSAAGEAAEEILEQGDAG